MIVISAQMFEKMTARARRMAELIFEQQFVDVTPEKREQLRELGLVESYEELIWERWGRAANELTQRRKSNRVEREDNE